MNTIKNVLFIGGCLFLYLFYAALLCGLAVVLCVGGIIVDWFTKE